MRKRSISQLNAISRSCTERDQKRAKGDLFLLYGIVDFDHFKRETGWKASPRVLLNHLKDESTKTIALYREYRKAFPGGPDHA